MIQLKCPLIDEAGMSDPHVLVREDASNDVDGAMQDDLQHMRG